MLVIVDYGDGVVVYECGEVMVLDAGECGLGCWCGCI